MCGSQQPKETLRFFHLKDKKLWKKFQETVPASMVGMSCRFRTWYTFAWLCLACSTELPFEEDCQEDCSINVIQMKATKDSVFPGETGEMDTSNWIHPSADSTQWHGHCGGPPGDAWCYTSDERLCRERRCEWIVDGTTPQPAWEKSDFRGSCVRMGPQQQCWGDELSCETTPGCTWTGNTISVTMAPMPGMPTMAPLPPIGGNCIGTPVDQVNCFGLPECQRLQSQWQGKKLCGGLVSATWTSLNDTASEKHVEKMAEMANKELKGLRRRTLALELPARWVEGQAPKQVNQLGASSQWYRFCALFGEVQTLELVRPMGTQSTVQLLISYKEPEFAGAFREALTDRYLIFVNSSIPDDCYPVCCVPGDGYSLREYFCSGASREKKPSNARDTTRDTRDPAAPAAAAAASLGTQTPKAPAPVGRSEAQGMSATGGFLLRRCGRGEVPGALRPAPETFQISKRRVDFGREDSCDVVLRHQHVSKVHSIFVLQTLPEGAGDMLLMQDNSSNGTWINGQRMTQGRFHQLQPGDRISFLQPSSVTLEEDVATWEVRRDPSVVVSEASPGATPGPPAPVPARPGAPAPKEAPRKKVVEEPSKADQGKSPAQDLKPASKTKKPAGSAVEAVPAARPPTRATAPPASPPPDPPEPRPKTAKRKAATAPPVAPKPMPVKRPAAPPEPAVEPPQKVRAAAKTQGKKPSKISKAEAESRATSQQELAEGYAALAAAYAQAQAEEEADEAEAEVPEPPAAPHADAHVAPQSAQAPEALAAPAWKSPPWRTTSMQLPPPPKSSPAEAASPASPAAQVAGQVLSQMRFIRPKARPGSNGYSTGTPRITPYLDMPRSPAKPPPPPPPKTSEEVADGLASNDISAWARAWKLESYEDIPLDIPCGLRKFLDDIHHSTWFKLDADQDSQVVTARGTRPGSPLADLGFNLLMSRLMHIIGDALQDIPEYVQGHAALGTTVPPISWVDDLAVPVATVDPSQLVPLIQKTIAILHSTFRSHGMTMNCDSGKSEVVLMFRGKGANPCRSAMFDTEHVPSIVAATDSHILTLKVVSSYRHLGARFTMDADVELEIDSRLAMARQAYQQMRRPIFQNHHIPLKGRLQLYDSLISSRLLYGCAVWSDVSTPYLTKLEAVLCNHYRRIGNLGFWTSAHMTDDAVRLHLEVPSFRIIWARHRLIYLFHVACHGHDYHRQLLLMEYQQGRGWLLEVQQELQWMSALVSLPFDVPQDLHSWNAVWNELPQCTTWKSLVKRACRKHLLQERIARDVGHYHELITSELTHAGFELFQGDAADADVTEPPAYACDKCDMIFQSAQALASHAYQVHDQLSSERQYVQSTICPGCLRDHHTTWRLQQHLKYRPNGCFDRIDGARQPDVPVTIRLAPHLRHVKRLPAVRRHHGPLRPTSAQRWRQVLRGRIATLRAAGDEFFAWWHPETDPALVQALFADLRAGLFEWCQLDTPTEIDFHDIMFNAMFLQNVPDLLAGRIFVHWIETEFHDLCPPDLHPDYVDCLESAHLSMLEDIPA
eukprot:s2027_g6.t1